MSKEKEELLKIWQMADRLKTALAGLDKMPASRSQRQAIESAQNNYRFWRYSILGELLNRYGLWPEKRDIPQGGTKRKE